MNAMNALETAVLHKLLEGDLPPLVRLREQCSHVSVRNREFTGVGFFTDFDHPPGVVRLESPSRAVFGDVIADIDGLEYGAGFLLIIESGVISVLEGYSYGETWPESIGRFSLRYSPPGRNLLPLLETGG